MAIHVSLFCWQRPVVIGYDEGYIRVSFPHDGHTGDDLFLFDMLADRGAIAVLEDIIQQAKALQEKKDSDTTSE